MRGKTRLVVFGTVASIALTLGLAGATVAGLSLPDSGNSKPDVSVCGSDKNPDGDFGTWDVICLERVLELDCLATADDIYETTECTRLAYEKAGIEFEPEPDPCKYDAEGYPLPGSPPGCGSVARCAECTPPPFKYDPTPTPVIRDNPSAILSEPAVHRVGDAASLGRTDCPADWQAAVSSTTGMSICFPADSKVTQGGPDDTDPQEEDRFEITLAGSDQDVAIINLVRAAGTTGPYGSNCDSPDTTAVDGRSTLTCIWPNGDSTLANSGIAPRFIMARVTDASGFQWVFEGSVWSPQNGGAENVDSLRLRIEQVLATWSLP